MNAPSKTRVFLSPPCMLGRERELLLDAFDSNWIAPLGPQLTAFEEEFARMAGRSHAVGLSSGTAALHLALIALGVQPGDTVVTSSFTFAATANAIRYVGATPIFVDSDTDSWNMDPELLAGVLRDAAAGGQLPRAVLVVDIVGQCARHDRIAEVCKQYGVPVVEDAAEALGATYLGRPAGSFGEIACFSFNGNKIITTSGGGMLVTDRPEIAKHVRHLATQARDPAPHYQHSEVGYNYRLSNLLAAVGRGQLEMLGEHVRRRRAIFERYRELLGNCPGITLMPEVAGGVSTRWLTVILLDPKTFGADREAVRMALEKENIESRPAWKPMHMQPVFADCPAVGGAVSEMLFDLGLCLPSGSALTEPEIERVCKIVLSCRK